MKEKIGMDRRRFIKGGLASLAAFSVPTIIPGSALGLNGATAPSNRITIAMIGLGAMGNSNMGGFFALDDCRIVAVCDVDSNRLAEAQKKVDGHYQGKGCDAYADFLQVVERKDIDAVCSCVPDHWHSLVAVAALRSGKDVYGEKPLAHDLRESRAICDAVTRYNRVWQTGCWQRSTGNFHHIVQLVLNGYLGDNLEVEVGLPNANGGAPMEKRKVVPVPAELDYERWLGPAPSAPYCPGRVHWDWRWNLATGGGQLLDWIGHHFDIAQWSLGLDRTGPVEIEGTGFFPKNDLYDAPENYHVQVRYANGQVIKIGGTKFYPMGVTYRGKKDWVYVDRGETKVSDPRFMKMWFPANDIQLIKSDNHHRNFLDSVRSRVETIAPAEPAHRALSAGYLGLVSMTLGRKLRWDPDREQVLGDDEANAMLGRAMRSPWHL